jgi:hypothetical protein
MNRADTIISVIERWRCSREEGSLENIFPFTFGKYSPDGDFMAVDILMAALTEDEYNRLRSRVDYLPEYESEFSRDGRDDFVVIAADKTYLYNVLRKVLS